ncbi:anti-sigma factor domain-containing protein [Gramella sp. KN1008]|uniref:anti-sigma factor n=1 Tax=Gramella sp. KN1008 TaxID=2529298 RepID=UPI00103F3ABD|nr:anti-sigma factor [Gramella sp. KN1008]TBW30241.1 anti-sigma factor [Gramella sp. KN1008]
MDINEYIASGILELYVAGALSEKENEEVHNMMLQYPEVHEEVLKIESSIVSLTAAASPSDSKQFFPSIKSKLHLQDETSKVIPIKRSRSSWITYSGWAAALIAGIALIYTVNELDNLKEEIQVVETNNDILEEQIEKANSDLAEVKNLVAILRDKNIITVPLQGQQINPEAYAKVYWNRKDDNIYLDAQGLPEPPRGKVYQVWSLKMSPLTPTSLGTLDDFSTDDNKIFRIANPNDSEAFGITLEPAGGSETPTMEQLFTIGVVAAAS